MLKHFSCFLLLELFINAEALSKPGFVALPMTASSGGSAYLACNNSGDYGRHVASVPDATTNNTCAILSDALVKSALSSPIEGFKLVGVQVSDVEMSPELSGSNSVVARLSEAIWRNTDKTECVLATQLEMQDAPLANGGYFEVNDIAHAGFAHKKVEVAYFYKPHSSETGGNTEVLFRAGRTFTSVATTPGQQALPELAASGATPATVQDSTAAIHSNWVDFTTDISFKDMDGVTRAISSIFYIKYPCDERDPVSVPNAIRLRSTGQSGQLPFELAVPGLIPADSRVELFE